jgi:hypothetical protein
VTVLLVVFKIPYRSVAYAAYQDSIWKGGLGIAEDDWNLKKIFRLKYEGIISDFILYREPIRI